MPYCALLYHLFQPEIKLQKLPDIQVDVQLALFIRTNTFLTCFTKYEIRYDVVLLLLKAAGERSFC